MAASGDIEKRSYYRVATSVPVRCRVLSAREEEALSLEVQTRRQPDLTGMDDDLRSWLARIEDKLDRILAHYETEDPGWITADGPLEIQLSGAGLKLPVLKKVPKGTPVLVDITIPAEPKIVARAVARVEACSGSGKSFELALSFQAISEADRDAVVAHVLEMQRSELRRRSDG